MKCCQFSSSDLRHTIDIEQSVGVKDSSGGQSTTWQRVLRPRAKVWDTLGWEKAVSGKLEAQKRVNIVIRYTAVPTEAMRVVLDGVEMQIRSIINIERRNKWLHILCEEGPAT